jgi:two-component system sensor histidine kinase CiaH
MMREFMDRQRFLLKRRIKYMVTLFVVFLLLLVSFDVVVFTVTRNALYQECDDQMLEAQEHIEQNPDNAISNFKNGKSIVYYENGSNYVIDYKIFILLRDTQGELLNTEYLTFFDYMLNLDFSQNHVGKILTEKVERNQQSLYYRTYVIRVDLSEGDTYYVQLATDTSDIEMSLSIIWKVLLLCTVVAMVLVLIGGWYLSRTLVSGVVEAWERQDEFISYASHEIRSPLAVIHSSLELMLERPGDKIIDRSDLILNSLTETSRLRKMTNNLLEMVRLQASEMMIHEEEINVGEMVEGFIEPFCFQAEATGKIMRYYVDEGLTMVADRQLLTELLVIFLENALKYTERGDIIRLMISQKNNAVEIRVEDSGTGLSEEGLQKVFSRFYREERQQSKSDGSGLGLYIAGLIVQAHKGSVKAEPNKPEGTVFIVTMPNKK